VTIQKKRAREKAWKRQRGLCFYCKKSVAKHKATLDHRVPACLGGNLQDDNAVMACYACNHEKGSMPASVFMAGEEAIRAWKRRSADTLRLLNSGAVAVDTAAQYGAMIGQAAERARAIMAVRAARTRDSGSRSQSHDREDGHGPEDGRAAEGIAQTEVGP
jgi:hypothetical protein